MKVIGITTGDPSGVGPEVVLKTLARFRIPRSVKLIVFGSPSVMAGTTGRLAIASPKWLRSTLTKPCLPDAPLSFVACAEVLEWRPGRTSAQAGRASITYLDEALKWHKSGYLHGLVTAPVTKWAIAESRRNFVGQTEYLATELKVRDVAMMFSCDSLRVVILTRHLPLRHVSRALTRRIVESSIRLTVDGLRKHFRISNPKLAVCGFNPHGGELKESTEERKVLEPVIRRFRQRGLRCDGPFGADGFFATGRPARRGTFRIPYDVVICCYHDQGLIPFKLLARDRGCQLSLGLPIIRTSPDHGSALDIAGKGIAHPGSMQHALQLAIQLS